MFKTVEIDLSKEYGLKQQGLKIEVNPIAWLPAVVAMKFNRFQDIDPNDAEAVVSAMNDMYPDLIASWTLTRSLLKMTVTDENKDDIAPLPDSENNIGSNIPLLIMNAIIKATQEDLGEIPLVREPSSSAESSGEGSPAESQPPAEETPAVPASQAG